MLAGVPLAFFWYSEMLARVPLAFFLPSKMLAGVPLAFFCPQKCSPESRWRFLALKNARRSPAGIF